ncbi:MAG: Na+/H+ antiporter [Acidimicrobiales bacterium]|nr:Na+/H+ antiporter [Acidimicrobiales bacterium]
MQLVLAEESTFLDQELTVIGLLAVAAVMAIVVQRVKLPYTVALVVVGGVLAFFPNFVDLDIPPELILGLLVPPLLFEATLHLPWSRLRADLLPVLLLAIFGTLASTFLVAWAVWALVGLPWVVSVAFGALISATDPVAVIAFFKTLGVSKRLAVLVEGESLFNDAVAIVAFNLAIAAGEPGKGFGLSDALGEFLLVGLGGLAVGVVLGLVVSQVILARVDDPLIETTTTLALAFASFLVAEEFGVIFGIDDFHLSGILAVVAAGLVVGNLGFGNTSPSTRITLENFWVVLAFLANSMVFLIIGLEIDLSELRPNLVDVLVAIGAVVLARLLLVYGTAVVHRSLQPGRRIPLGFQHVQYWGGLRGAISLALALTLAEEDLEQAVVDDVLLMTFGVVLFTLLVQGTTMGTLIDRLGLGGVAVNEEEQQRRQARVYALRAGREELSNLGRSGVLFADMATAMSSNYDRQLADAQGDLGEHFRRHPELEVSMLLQARRDALLAERSAVSDLERRGLVNDGVAHELITELDNRLAALDLIEERWESDTHPGPAPT